MMSGPMEKRPIIEMTIRSQLSVVGAEGKA